MLHIEGIGSRHHRPGLSCDFVGVVLDLKERKDELGVEDFSEDKIHLRRVTYPKSRAPGDSAVLTYLEW